jgi:hypothetical protein
MLYLLLIERKKRKKKQNVQGLYSQGRYALLAMPHRDFPAVRYN